MKRTNFIEAMCAEIRDFTGVADVFPSAFPAMAKSKCIVVSIVGGQPSKDTVQYCSLQVATRAEHPQDSYNLAVEIIETLSNMHDARLVSGEVIVSIKEQHPFPLYLGEDENKRHMYSTNFSVVMSRE